MRLVDKPFAVRHDLSLFAAPVHSSANCCNGLYDASDGLRFAFTHDVPGRNSAQLVKCV
jgi:hypothetical protein